MYKGITCMIFAANAFDRYFKHYKDKSVRLIIDVSTVLIKWKFNDTMNNWYNKWWIIL